MVVQADGASYAMDADPERARRALEAISATGRQALTEMRRLLGVLRGTTTRAGSAPAARRRPAHRPHRPGPRRRAAGRVHVGGVPHPLPRGLELTPTGSSRRR